MLKKIFKIILHSILLFVSLGVIFIISFLAFLMTDEFLTRDDFHQFMEECVNDGNDYRTCLSRWA